MSRSSSKSLDAELDAWLRNISEPDGLVERLRLSLLTDDVLDGILRDVTPPVGLVDRVRQAILTTAPDEPDADARFPYAKPVSYLSAPWRRSVKTHGRRMRLSQWIGALALMLVLGLGYVGVMTGLLVSTRTASPTALATEENRLIGPAAADDFIPAYWRLPPESLLPGGVAEMAGISSPLAPALRFDADMPSGRSWMEDMERWFGPGGLDPSTDTALPLWGGVFASHRPFDELPDLKKAAALDPRGIAWPLVAGANNAFLIRYGAHPFVSPAAHPLLQSMTVPLRHDSGSYELTKRWLEDGELPPPQSLRTEDFLAALDYEFPRPTGAPLGLSVAAGPSPLGAQGMRLLQIGVQAAGYQDVARPPARLVLALDVSASMRWGGRFDSARQALSKLIRQFGAGDRAALVAFSEEAEIVCDDASVEGADEFLAAVRSLTVGGSTNVGAGLCRAYSVAEQLAIRRGEPVRVVLLTDGLAELDQLTAERIRRRLTESAAHGISLDIVDLGQEKGLDPQLTDFARAGGGAVRRAATADEIRWALLETVTGRSQRAANGVAMRVSFNPQTVAAYRIFGHEARAVAGVLPDRSTADFHVDQSATVLYEVQLKPDGGRRVATVELSWQPPDGGTRQTVTRQIERGEFAAAFASAPLSLQEAAVAAATAEVLRGSPFAAAPYSAVSLARVRELAGGADSHLRQRPSFGDFMATVEKAAGLKPRRGGVL